MRASLLVLLAAALWPQGCGTPKAVSLLNLKEVRLPNGARIQCEVMIRPEDMARGMMYRDSLAPDRGMLFVHTQPGAYTYWMHNVRIPLDIIWMDAARRIVEMSPNTPPCQKAAAECPHYGGGVESSVVLELAGGSIARHGLKVGDRLEF
jgi:hypothetical protein